MRIEYLDYFRPFIGEEEINEVIECLRSGWITTGSKVKRFENEFSEYIGCKYAIAVNSGTAALHLALDAIGLKRGNKVIVPTFTFGASAEVVSYFGAQPIFFDVDPMTFNISVEKFEEYLNRKNDDIHCIKAIIPVHFAGQSCNMKKILKLAKLYDFKVIEDAAHAIPTCYKDKMVGTIGDLTAFSFYATKCITTGEGGMITTDNEKWAHKMSIMRLHGISKDAWKRYTANSSWYYEINYPGYKYNMTDIAAAIGIHQLKKCDMMYEKRKYIAAQYNHAFYELDDYLSIPYLYQENIKYPHSWHLYVIQLNLKKLTIDRAQFIEEMKKRNIGTSVHFTPLHLQPYYQRTYGYKMGDFPNAERIYERCLSLPIYPKMTDEDITDVIESVKEIVGRYKT
jgi:dTDP-4-amino-4,6-dideoxygalactose transaminase